MLKYFPISAEYAETTIGKQFINCHKNPLKFLFFCASRLNSFNQWCKLGGGAICFTDQLQSVQATCLKAIYANGVCKTHKHVPNLQKSVATDSMRASNAYD